MRNVTVLKRFEISGLFGLHDYKMNFGANPAGEMLHETFLYGDNGTGKTTILKLMYPRINWRPYSKHASKSSPSDF
jgi:hypothetical protein